MLAKVKERQDGMMLAKVNKQDGIGTRWNIACNSKNPKYPYISSLNQRGGYNLIKELMVANWCDLTVIQF